MEKSDLMDVGKAGRRYFIHTFGCQMNEADSSRLGETLRGMGFSPTDSADEADIILLNTCAVREKAEQKMLSALGRYRLLKQTRGALIGVAGCVAQQEKEALLRKVPYIDFVLGPDAVSKIDEIIRRFQEDRRRISHTEWVAASQYVFPKADPESARGKVSRLVTVMKGCDRLCAYCVVPFVRGRELSRPVEEVLNEVRGLAQVGVREVTLIGQNVNSYRGGADFAELLEKVCAIDGIMRVRFTTSNPCDLPDKLIDAFAVNAKLMPHFHLPVQSGSNKVIERMGRGHTTEHYFERAGRLQQARPGMALTSDIIVGFPGETEQDFSETLALIERVRFDNVYSFVYSPRPRTVAARREEEWGRVEYDVKVERLKRLQARVRAISLEKGEALVGKEVEVMVEGPSKTDSTRRFGRNPENRVVNFQGDASPGELVRVEIESATSNAVFGIERPG